MRTVAWRSAAVVVSLVVAGCAATTDPASKVGALTATLNAHGHTDSSPAQYWFEYATNPSDLGTAAGFRTPTRGPIPPNVPGNGGDAAFSENVGGLTLGTTYYYRVCGSDSQVQNGCSNTQSFTTASSPTITTYRVPTASAGLTHLTAGPDGALWFTERTANQIGRITTSGRVTEYKVPTAGAGLQGITAGPDGALWFTEQSADKIGRIATNGTITEFSVPTKNAGPFSITAGPDGALWFTEQNANQIGRITTAGKVTKFAVPTSNSGPYGITAGPDGALWFTESSAAKVGRITTAGAFTEYTMPSSCSGGMCIPGAIAAGSDGALWFSDGFFSGTIWRVTTSGTFTQFPAGGLHTSTSDVAPGPDGALWFWSGGCLPPSGQECSQGLGRMTTQGQFSLFDNQLSGPGVSSHTSPVSGPDGAVWFLNPTANQIGRGG